MNRLQATFAERRNRKLLNIYFTAGYPTLDSTLPILKMLQNAGADMVEIGIPFSDPVADGPVIQQSNQKAIENGMNLKLLFETLKTIREEIEIPLLLMGYLNPVIQFGMEHFLEKCKEVGVDGLILPDLPIKEYQKHYKSLYIQYGILPVFLATPETSEERLRQIDAESTGFVYILSATAITGQFDKTMQQSDDALERLHLFPFTKERMTGFGIRDNQSFEKSTRHTSGGIIGTAFIKLLEHGIPDEAIIKQFVQSIKS
ncbi:MAG: tryptophan synthase subunit alpha [Flavobacteriales bacterium]